MIPSLEKIEEREENIRERTKNIISDQRVLYYNEINKRIKDPDTYATLNYFFLVGVHHFYLGKWIRGSLNIYFCGIGIYFIFSPGTGNNTEWLAVVGVLIVLLITLMETYSLFRSQSIVKHYNNNTMEKILRKFT